MYLRFYIFFLVLICLPYCSWSGEVTVNFTGQLYKAPCDIDNNNINIDLGHIEYNQLKSTGFVVGPSFKISLVNCDLSQMSNMNNIYVAMTGKIPSSASTSSNIPNERLLSTTLPNIYLALCKNKDGPNDSCIDFNNVAISYLPINKSKSYDLVYYPYVINDNEKHMNLGDFSGSVTFTISYL